MVDQNQILIVKEDENQNQPPRYQVDNSNQNYNEEEEEVKEPNLDSGYAWWILLVMFLLSSTTSGTSRVYGLVYARQISTGYYDHEQASWPIATASTIENLAGILTPALAQFLSWRQIQLLSTILFIISNLGAYFSNSLLIDILCLGIIQGLALSTGTVLTLAINNDYFERFRTTAYGIAMSGATCGVFILCPLIEFILNNNPDNFRPVYLTLSLVLILNLILSLFIIPRSETKSVIKFKEEKKNLIIINSNNNKRIFELKNRIKELPEMEQKTPKLARKISKFESHFERTNSIASINIETKTRRVSVLARKISISSKKSFNNENKLNNGDETSYASKKISISSFQQQKQQQQQFEQNSIGHSNEFIVPIQKNIFSISNVNNEKLQPTSNHSLPLKATNSNNKEFDIYNNNNNNNNKISIFNQKNSNDKTDNNIRDHFSMDLSKFFLSLGHKNNIKKGKNFRSAIATSESLFSNNNNNNNNSKRGYNLEKELPSKESNIIIFNNINPSIELPTTTTTTVATTNTKPTIIEKNYFNSQEANNNNNNNNNNNIGIENPDKCQSKVEHLEEEVESESEQVVGLIDSFKLLSSPYIHCVWIMLTIYYLVSRIFIIILADFGDDHGLNNIDSNKLLNYWSLGELLGRVLLASIIDLRWLTVKWCIILTCSILSIVILLMALIENYYIYVICSILIASFSSLEYMLINALMVEYLGKNKAINCYSIAALISSILLFARPSLIGLFRDNYGSYDGLLILLSIICLIFTILFTLLEPLFVRLWPKPTFSLLSQQAVD